MRALIFFILSLISCFEAIAGTRIKDITFPQGVRNYQLLGYGLVIGLQGTGDTLRNSPFTEQATMSMLDRMGINIRANAMRTRNIAAVLVTAELPPFAGWGSTLDATVSSLGDATSLMGGTLVMTSLSGVDGNTYALAQGPIAVSGFAANGQNETLTHGVATVGRIPNGASIEKEPPRPMGEPGLIVLELRNPDFLTSTRIADVINKFVGGHRRSPIARERDSRSVSVRVPQGDSPTKLLAQIGDLLVNPSTPARVVIDERTGTVVIGEDVQISPIAVTQGGLTIRVKETPDVSQPAPMSNGQTVVTSRTSISANEQNGQVATLAGPTLKTLVRGLNQIGLTPTGIISILQAIKSAGALQAELVIQ